MDNYKSKSKEELIQIIENLKRKDDEIHIDELLSSIQDFIFVFDKEQRFKFVNIPESSKLLVKPEIFLEKKHSEVMPIDVDDKFQKAFNNNKIGKPSSYEYQLVKDNQIFDYFAKISPLYNEGKFSGSIAIVSDITEENILRKALVNEAKFNEKILETSNAIIVGLDRNHIVTFFNSGAEKATGYKASEVVGKDWFSMFIPSTIIDEIGNVWESAWNKKFHSYTNSIIIKNGGKKIISWQSTGFYNDIDTNNHYLISIGEDITEREQAKEKLLKSEIKFKLLADYTFDWEYWLGINGEYLYISPSCKKTSGYSQEEFIANPNLLFDIVHPDFKKGVHQHYHDENNKDTDIYKSEFKIINKKGKTRWIEHNCSPIFNEKGEYAGRRGNNRDITEKKIKENKIKESKKQFEDLFFTIPDAISLTTLKGRYIEINKGFTKITGYKREDVIGKTSADINIWTKPNDRNIFMKKLQSNSNVDNMKTQFYIKNGEKIKALSSANIVTIDNKPYILTISKDITKLEKVKKDLKRSEEKFRLFFENNSTIMLEIDPETKKILNANNKAIKFYGYTKSELIGKSMNKINSSLIDKYIEETIKNKASTTKAKQKLKNGEVRDVSIYASYINKRKKNHIFTITFDITQSTKNENELNIYKNNLEKLVKERTEELETLNEELYEANKDLEKFNDLFINREFRIKELKDRIKELEGKH